MFGNTYNQDMSQVYVSEPATNGKVVLHTSVGDIDVELVRGCRSDLSMPPGVG